MPSSRKLCENLSDAGLERQIWRSMLLARELVSRNARYGIIDLELQELEQLLSVRRARDSALQLSV